MTVINIIPEELSKYLVQYGERYAANGVLGRYYSGDLSQDGGQWFELVEKNTTIMFVANGCVWMTSLESVIPRSGGWILKGKADYRQIEIFVYKSGSSVEPLSYVAGNWLPDSILSDLAIM